MTYQFTPIEKLDKKIKYNIVGIRKCGTSALAVYLRDKGYDVLESELDFYNTEIAESHDYSLRTPIVITRNPIERAWSDFNFFGLDLKTACGHSYYKAGLQMWEGVIFSLEYLIKIKDFPLINKNEAKPIMTDEIKKEIIKELGLSKC